MPGSNGGGATYKEAGPHDGQLDRAGRGTKAGSHGGTEGVFYYGTNGGSYDSTAAFADGGSYNSTAAYANGGSYDSAAAFFNDGTATLFDDGTAIFFDDGAAAFSKDGVVACYSNVAKAFDIDDPSGTTRGAERESVDGVRDCSDASVGCIWAAAYANDGSPYATGGHGYADTRRDNGSQDVAFDQGDPLSEARGCYQQDATGTRDSSGCTGPRGSGEFILRRRPLGCFLSEDHQLAASSAESKGSGQPEASSAGCIGVGESACACVCQPGASSTGCIGVGQSACACVGRCLGSACLGVGDACACACVEQSVGRSHGPSIFQSIAYPAEVRPSPSPMEQGLGDLRELFGDEGVDEVEGLAEAERVAEIERQRQPPDNINPTKDPEMIDSFPEDISAESKLRHQRQGHVPYWAECPSCVRARGLAPARSRSEIDPLECQMDQYFYRGIRLVAIVHVPTYCIGAAATYSGEARTTTVRNLVKFLRSFGLKHVHLVHDGEPLMSAIASEIVAITGGNSTSTKTSPSRHAPVAERAIRTLKEIASTNELHAKGVSGLKLLANDEAMELLHVHAASSHNRFASNTGNMLCPLQRALGESYTPHLLFPFACIIYIQPPEHLSSQVDGRYDIGSYLGPVVGGFGHNVMLRLSNGSMKRCVAKALKMAYPVTYSSNLLPSLAEVNPDEPDYESLPGIALPRKAVPLPQPPAEWLEGNKTPRCPGCLGRSRFHSRKCKVRFRDYVRNTLGDLDNPEPQQQTSGKPRVHFDPQPEVVEFQEEAEYEPILPGAGEEAAPSPFDVSASPSPQEDFPLEYLPGGDVEMDQVDVEDYTVPMELAVTPEALDGQGMLQLMYAVIPHQKHHLSPCEYDDLGLFASQLKRKTPAQHGNPDEGVVMPFGDREVWIIKPTSVVDDVSGLPLDPEKTWVGMQKEVAAMHSLGVGNVRSYQEVKAHCDETGAKIVKSRFVFTDKVDVDQQHIVRARLVAKDFAFNQPSALDLGIASQTASVEAFKAFICRVVQDMLVLWGLDVSTAFLYAKLVLDTVLELPGCFQNLDGSKAYVILEKAIYGLRSAGLSWQKHLAGLLAELGLFPSLIEPTLYKGYWGDILVLCLVYVDDILLATRSKETNQQLLDFLTGRLKVKLTGRLEEDGRIGFLGREIIKRGRDILLAVKKEYVESIFEAFGWNREARRKMKACTVPPDLRSVLDKEDPAKPSEELSPEAASRYRSTLGKLGWLVQTRGDLCYFHSLLSRGQSCPRAVHEECMRKVLRWLLEVPDLVQVFQKDFEAEPGKATLSGYSDANWASERSTGRKSTSGGVIYLNGNCIKTYSRLQPIVALSSAESELFAMVEMARELIGLGQLISHVFDHVTSPLDLATDSASARQVSMMSGFLRRMRHVDLRLCFLQDKVENGEILVQHVPGTDNVADLLTKNLSATQTWYHIVQLGLEERLTRSVFLSEDALPVRCTLFVCMKGLFSASADDPWTLLIGRCKLQTPHYVVMVEFCTSGEAWLTRLANHYGIHAIPVVAEVDATLPETMELIEASLQLASRKNMHVIVWASTPCTGGSPWQRFHRARDEQYYDDKMKGLFTVHRKLWKGFLKLVNTSTSTTWVIEWPQRCAYWGWASTKSFLKLNRHESTLVFGCACGMIGSDGLPIKKVWRLCSSSHVLIHCMSKLKCPGDHEHSKSYVLRSTQHYPEAFAHTALRALSAW